MAENGPKKNAAIEWLRELAAQIPESEVPEPRFFMDPRSLSILNMARAGANSALNWLDATNRALQGYDPRGALEEGDIIAPLGAATMAAPFLRGAVRAAKPALNSSTLGSRNASIFDPPEVPKRAFSEDYPSGARADDTGRLTHDIEGRPLTAETVVGRRMVGGEDEAFPPSQLDAFTETTTGLPPARVAGKTISGDAGRLVKDTDRRSGNRAYAVLINSGLSPQQAVRVLAHENAHIIDEIAGQIPIAGLNKELGQVYHDLNDATWRRGKPTKPSLQTTPEMFGYAPDKRPRELMAEAVRAYLTDPNYIKSIAPKTAARIRKFVNENEELARVIQFNADQSRSSLPGTVINAAAEPQGIRAYHGSPYDQGFATGGAVKTGPLVSDVPGRTDQHPIDVPEGAFVFPADVVSALGEGNTLAGMRVLQALYPEPMRAGKIKRHTEIPPPKKRRQFEAGGSVPIAAAGGEYIASPEAVAATAGGDLEAGFRIAEELCRRVRANNIKTLANLPPPQK